MPFKPSKVILAIFITALAVILITGFTLKSMSHDLCDVSELNISSFLVEHGFKASTSHDECVSTIRAGIVISAAWISACMFLVSSVVCLIWYLTALSGIKVPENVDFVVDSRQEQLDIEQGLLSWGGREPRYIVEDGDTEGWEPVEMSSTSYDG